MGTKTALVVDDSKSARFALRKALESFGYRVDTAESADDAYLMLRSQRPDVVFLDHLMPGCDGFEALRELQRNPRTAGLPVVLCSSNEGDEFVRRARAAGAAEVLPKPASAEQIRAVLERLERLHGPASPAPSSSKVLPIREPEVTIEQAVMRNLRDALPALDPETPREAVPGPGAASARELERLRETLDARLRGITQDWYVQVAEIKAQLTHLAAAGVRDEECLRELATRAVELQLDAVLQQLETQLERLRAGFDERIRAQDQRLDQLAASLRQAVVEEAHAVAERAVMNAAARISSQLADSILHALKRNAARA
ncbi:MAG: response regulator [Nevskia sp.]|nr:response regulator [Nevskia sp.]